MASEMTLWERIKHVWKEKFVSCFAACDESDERNQLPTPSKRPTLYLRQSASVNLDAFDAYYSYILQQTLADHVTFRATSRSSCWKPSTKLSLKIYLFLLTFALVTVVNARPPFLHRNPPGPSLAELHSGFTAEATNHPTQTQDQHQGQPQPAQVNSDIHMTSEPSASAADQTSDVDKIGDAWVVQGVGTFYNKAVYTFTGGILPEGLIASDYPVQDSERYMGEGVPPIPYNHRFEPQNVQIRNGSLFLRVPGKQKPRRRQNKDISSAQIETAETKILYASVRTRARFSSVPGTCHGIFFYSNDQHETDIEYLTDPRSLSNNGPDDPIPIWYSNQKRDPIESPPSAETGPSPFDVTSRVHEYRIDWAAEFTAFYIDGILQKSLTENVPSLPGPWLWNNWANGDKGWSVGPPTDDNELEIKSIVMYYNTLTPDDE